MAKKRKRGKTSNPAGPVLFSSPLREQIEQQLGLGGLSSGGLFVVAGRRRYSQAPRVAARGLLRSAFRVLAPQGRDPRPFPSPDGSTLSGYAYFLILFEFAGPDLSALR